MNFTRVRAFIVVGALILVAAAFVVVAVVRDSQRGVAAGRDCPPGVPRASLRLPREPAAVTVKVLNGTGKPGVAEDATEAFRTRRFRVQPPAGDRRRVKGVAVLRYGPDAVGSAQLIAAYFLGRADMEYSAKRTGRVVEVSIGNAFQQLATMTEVNQSLAQLGEPLVPPGACAAPATER